MTAPDTPPTEVTPRRTPPADAVRSEVPPVSTVPELLLGLDALAQDAADLTAALAEELAACAETSAGDGADDEPEDRDASAVRLALAETVLPLSLKDGPGMGSATTRHLDGLRRRRVRLQREGAVLAEQNAALRERGRQLDAKASGLRERGASLQERAAAVRERAVAGAAQRQRQVEWAAAMAAHSAALLAWTRRVARHTELIGHHSRRAAAVRTRWEAAGMVYGSGGQEQGRRSRSDHARVAYIRSRLRQTK